MKEIEMKTISVLLPTCVLVLVGVMTLAGCQERSRSIPATGSNEVGQKGSRYE